MSTATGTLFALRDLTDEEIAVARAETEARHVEYRAADLVRAAKMMAEGLDALRRASLALESGDASTARVLLSQGREDIASADEIRFPTCPQHDR